MASLQSHMLNMFIRMVIRPNLHPEMDLSEVRGRMKRLDPGIAYLPRGASMDPFEMAGIDGAKVTTPASEPDRVILYLHGGAFCWSSPHVHGRLLAHLCRKTGATGFMPEYALAPERAVSEAHDDCFNAYKWLLERGYRPDQIVIAGDSAGGCLAVSTAIQARDAGLPQPAGLALLAPFADATLTSPTLDELDGIDPMFRKATLEHLRSSVAIHHEHVDDPRYSPARADLNGLAPMRIDVGGYDMLLGDARLLAAEARKQGVTVDLNVWPGLPHVFQAFDWVPEAKRSIDDIATFISARLDTAKRKRALN